MKVIFRETVQGVAKAFEIKKVSDGYARNFLFPNKLAFVIPSNEADQLIKKAQQHEAHLELVAKEKESALHTLHNKTVTLSAPANETGVLFGGVSEKEIARSVLEQLYVRVPESAIILDKPVKHVGDHTVHVRFGTQSNSFTLRVTNN